VRAGLAAVPYLLRQQRWKVAAALLEDAFLLDPSRANAAAVLPAIEQIIPHDPLAAGLLARVLAVIDPVAAFVRLRAAMADAADRGEYRAASVAAGRLIALCREGGQLAEALDLAGQKADYTRRAGLGPWTQLADEVGRLQVLLAMGQTDRVLDEVTRLRARMKTLPATASPDETATPWEVRETLLDTGRHAAERLGRHADALALNGEVVSSLRARRAPATDIAVARFYDHGPLLSLGRTKDALRVLLDCRQVFQDARDTRKLGNTLSALARTEDARGHGEAALRLERDALRYLYLAGDLEGIAASYHNLGNYLAVHARQPAPALASHLTSALIRTLTRMFGTDDSIQAAGADLRLFGAEAIAPADLADLYRQAGDIPGTDLPGLLAALSPDPETAEQALRDLIAQARASRRDSATLWAKPW
jgi:tetratricopeptide (TPR) repeat protein